jgi:hypothetical protein
VAKTLIGWPDTSDVTLLLTAYSQLYPKGKGYELKNTERVGDKLAVSISTIPRMEPVVQGLTGRITGLLDEGTTPAIFSGRLPPKVPIFQDFHVGRSCGRTDSISVG